MYSSTWSTPEATTTARGCPPASRGYSVRSASKWAMTTAKACSTAAMSGVPSSARPIRTFLLRGPWRWGWHPSRSWAFCDHVSSCSPAVPATKTTSWRAICRIPAPAPLRYVSGVPSLADVRGEFADRTARRPPIRHAVRRYDDTAGTRTPPLQAEDRSAWTTCVNAREVGNAAAMDSFPAASHRSLPRPAGDRGQVDTPPAEREADRAPRSPARASVRRPCASRPPCGVCRG